MRFCNSCWHISLLSTLVLITSCVKEPTPVGDGTVDPCLNDTCGNGLLCDPEECDDGNDISWDGCSSSCQKEAGEKLTYMSWNILVSDQKYKSSVLYEGTTYTYQVDYSQWEGASPLPPRAESLERAISSLPEQPPIISVVEMDALWKVPANYAHITVNGYRALYPHTPFMLTQLIYKPDQVNLLEKNYINLSSFYGTYGQSMKSATTYGVFQMKSNGEIFVILSTHWEPNVGVTMQYGLGKALDTIYECEIIREKQAEESCELIAKLREAYPTAHIIYGGDLNTIDFAILYELIAALLPKFDSPELILPMAFAAVGSKAPVTPDFQGGVEIFKQCSGLISSRASAIANNVAINDATTIENKAIPALVTDSGVPIVIDYSFYSPEFKLLSYEVMESEDFVKVSDHKAVKLELEYYPRGEAFREVPVFPDDTSSDLYLPAAIYQGHKYPPK